MKKVIRIDFCDVPAHLDKDNNYFYNLLSRRFTVRLCDKPDFLFYSDQGSHHKLYVCPKIYFTIECHQPNFTECDFAFTGNYLDDPRHVRLPVYVHYCAGGAPSILKDPACLPELLAQKTKFCSLLTSNVSTPTTRTRTEFFHRLCRYKKVDSGGGALNNLGHIVPGGGKRDFLKDYKFNIAFENESVPGYTSEKIFEAMQAGCVPIYWGNPLIHREFNPASFLNYFDFTSEEALIEKIIELDQDEAQYFEYLRQPYFHGNQPSQYFDDEALLDRFERIFFTPIKPVSQRRVSVFGRWILLKKHKPGTR